MQEKTQVIKYDLLVCPHLKPAKMLCTSSQCSKCSFMCLQEDCQICTTAHTQCQIYKLPKVISKLNGKKQQITPQIQAAINAMEKVYDQAIQKLSIYKQLARTQMELFGYHEGQLEFLQKINDGLIKEINGKITSKVISTLNIKLLFNATQELISKFWDRKHQQFDEIFQTLKKLPNNQFNALKSEILKQEEDLKWLESCFEGELILRYTKLFRASQNSWNVGTFHSKCDGKGNTLTIARTQYDRIIGGFTSVPWSSNSSYTMDTTAQGNKRSFLYSVTNKQKYPTIDGSNVTYGNSGYGPTFGSGHDFYIADQSHNNTSSYFNFPYSFNTEDRKYVNGGQAYAAFAGTENGQYSCRVTDWEVYQIDFA